LTLKTKVNLLEIKWFDPNSKGFLWFPKQSQNAFKGFIPGNHLSPCQILPT